MRPPSRYSVSPLPAAATVTDRLSFSAILAEVWAWLRSRRPSLPEQVRQLEVVDAIAEDEADRLAPNGKSGE